MAPPEVEPRLSVRWDGMLTSRIAHARTEGAMHEKPLTAQSLIPTEPEPAAWATARERLSDASTYWLETSLPDGRSHVVSVLAV
jgi:hypothetical protein